MWAAQLGALRHLHNRKQGIDLFSEISYALGLNDRIEVLASESPQNVADIIDLQAERQRVARQRASGGDDDHPGSGLPGD